jgi:Myb-like DNA-binding protein FlbD
MLSEQGLNKRNWEGKEDVLLLELHAAYGPNWTRIAGGMGIRSAKQCRERYTQHLKPGINRSPISDEEGRQIMRMVSESGQRWAQIARNLGTNRSDNQIKNWWNGAKRKETSKRQEAGQQEQQTQHHQYPQDLSPSPGLAALPERRGILPPLPLDIPFRQDHAPTPFEAPRSRSSSARSYDSARPPSLVSDNGSSWSLSQPASASCSPTTFSLPPLLFAPPTPPTGNCCLPAPSTTYPNHSGSFGPVRRSSEVVLQPNSSSYSPQSRYATTAPTTPVGRASSRWEPYPTRGRRPSTGYCRDGGERESEKRDKGSLSFLLN